MVKSHLRDYWGWTNVSVFSLSDLGLDWKTWDSARLGDPLYQRRGAVSQELCRPGAASSYLGEYWSSFTHGLLTEALVDGPFANGWFMQLFGPEEGQLQREFTYLKQIKAMNIERPPWIHSIVGLDFKTNG
eukprot:gnl/TRDRNA2_/TRDRNA2_164985_c0_seq2.p1 gnl/TRDRNA2_/TRDRNA2_164985_c0~~gnl/TRDRNA2_/TRDRNA2_164985_c0_seq2.p1  ORF type:complete len:131 (+),score=5.15 gnl/TRDRNA2_/TRDRNA2_164985_c0_seq2:266-658(+)